jgi:hypothetical protein
MVGDWREITGDALLRWHARLGATCLEAAVQERLSNRYWIARMRRILGEGLIADH